MLQQNEKKEFERINSWYQLQCQTFNLFTEIMYQFIHNSESNK